MTSTKVQEFPIFDLIRQNMSVSHLAFGRDGMPSRTLFWKDVYCERESEIEKFRRLFLNSKHPKLLLITGPVGCGKSTYVLHKLEANCDGLPLCSGVRFDFKRLPRQMLGKLSKNQAKSTSEMEYLRAQVATLINKELVQILRTSLRRALFDYMREGKMITQQAQFQCRPIEISHPADNLRGTAEFELDSYLAALIALLSPSNIAKNLRLDAFDSNSVADYDQFTHLHKYVCKHKSVITNLLGHFVEESENINESKDPLYWCEIIAALALSDCPPAIFFDNADVAPLAFHSLIMHCVDDFARELATRNILVRCAVSFRDENIPTSSYRERMGESPHIQLSHAALGYGHDGESAMHEANPLTAIRLSEILAKRLRFTIKQSKEKCTNKERKLLSTFVKTVRSVWVTRYDNIGNRELRKPHLGLAGLTNESVRLALSLATSTTLRRVEERAAMRPKKPTVFELRHETIEWLFEQDPAGKN